MEHVGAWYMGAWRGKAGRQPSALGDALEHTSTKPQWHRGRPKVDPSCKHLHDASMPPACASAAAGQHATRSQHMRCMAPAPTCTTTLFLRQALISEALACSLVEASSSLARLHQRLRRLWRQAL